MTKSVGQAFQPAGCGAFQRRDPGRRWFRGLESPPEPAGSKACPTVVDAGSCNNQQNSKLSYGAKCNSVMSNKVIPAVFPE
ncbi:MAG: hypothetical protein C5B50_21150 [Verrucomicrobia bacterium]|nr:MAG: hypothetical protein C5B50_21150 [Verrucomicrobiota bacterium]